MNKKIPTVEEIIKQTPKNKWLNDPFYFIPRQIAYRLVRFLMYAMPSVTGNQISILLGILFILSAILIASNKFIVLALVLLYICNILDSLDGRLARAKKNKQLFLGFIVNAHSTRL